MNVFPLTVIQVQVLLWGGRKKIAWATWVSLYIWQRLCHLTHFSPVCAIFLSQSLEFLIWSISPLMTALQCLSLYSQLATHSSPASSFPTQFTCILLPDYTPAVFRPPVFHSSFTVSQQIRQERCRIFYVGAGWVLHFNYLKTIKT